VQKTKHSAEKPGRGGKRKGAGRPRNCAAIERFGIGLAAEHAWNQSIHEAAIERIAQRSLIRDLTQAQDRKISVFRKHQILAAARRFGRPLTEHELGGLSTPLSARAVRLSPEERQQIIADRKRYFSERYRKPYARRLSILSTVAKKFHVKESFVADCWKEYRAFVKRIQSENYVPKVNAQLEWANSPLQDPDTGKSS